jgi:hypothetical protein
MTPVAMETSRQTSSWSYPVSVDTAHCPRFGGAAFLDQAASCRSTDRSPRAAEQPPQQASRRRPDPAPDDGSRLTVQPPDPCGFRPRRASDGLGWRLLALLLMRSGWRRAPSRARCRFRGRVVPRRQGVRAPRGATRPNPSCSPACRVRKPRSLDRRPRLGAESSSSRGGARRARREGGVRVRGGRFTIGRQAPVFVQAWWP